MAAKICADIKPSGLRQGDLVDLLYYVVASIKGICEKLDADTGASIVLTTYEANCYTAIFNCRIENSKGQSLENFITPSSTVPEPVFVSPRGIGGRELIDLLYMILDSLETLTEQLDSDNCASSAYEATNYTAVVLALVENSRSLTVGNGTAFRFHAASAPQKELVDLLYQIKRCLYLTTTLLDADGTADTDYTSLWFTNSILLTLENSSGDRIGN